MRILVYIERKGNKAAASSLELLGLAERLGQKADVFLFGRELEEAAVEASAYGARKVYLFESGEEELEEAILEPLSSLAEDYDLILLPATRSGKSLTPQLAGKIGAAALNDVLELEEGEDGLIAKIPVYAGRFQQRVRILSQKAVISIRPGSYEKPQKGKNESLLEHMEEKEDEKRKTYLLESVRKVSEEIDLKEAEIIVSGGRGMGSKENYEKLCGELARVLGAGLGASRSAVNQGWIGQEHQVGQTGNRVKPKLYIACGISGAPQHLAGMRDSDYILAINKDENAEIFDLADISLVADVNEVMPLLIEEIKKKKAEG